MPTSSREHPGFRCASPGCTTSVGIETCFSVASATLPSSSRLIGFRPRLPITSMSARDSMASEATTCVGVPSRISTRTCRPCSVSTAASPASAARVSSAESPGSCLV